MRYATLVKVFRFESAHSLPGHRGKCANLHGHSYQLEVAVRGPMREDKGSDEGMVIDLDDLRRMVQETVITRLDHHNLNDILPCRTTAENVAHWIWEQLDGQMATLLFRVRLWETATGWAEVTRDDR
ncbi:MAG: 6-carboxytetrahydropterin synthase QueD [Herpetosiphon sp.]